MKVNHIRLPTRAVAPVARRMERTAELSKTFRFIFSVNLTWISLVLPHAKHDVRVNLYRN